MCYICGLGFSFFTEKKINNVLSDEFVEWLFIAKSENQCLLEMVMEKEGLQAYFKNLDVE